MSISVFYSYYSFFWKWGTRTLTVSGPQTYPWKRSSTVGLPPSSGPPSSEGSTRRESTGDSLRALNMWNSSIRYTHFLNRPSNCQEKVSLYYYTSMDLSRFCQHSRWDEDFRDPQNSSNTLHCGYPVWCLSFIYYIKFNVHGGCWKAGTYWVLGMIQHGC